MRLSAEQQAMITSQRQASASTRRATVPEMEELLYEALPVLDHGFIRVVDYMGDDAAICQAARVSYGAGTKQVSNDRGLINYLMRHRHTSPFEMCELKLHVKLPIFVARQWIRHRMANVNEYSARYSVMEREFYLPDDEFTKLEKDKKTREKRAGTEQTSLFEAPSAAPKDSAAQSTTNKQGREDVLESERVKEHIRTMSRISSAAFTAYDKLLGNDEQAGLARELARSVLPVSTYTQWYWKTDLHNLLHFISLRADHHAQYEIRAYADVLFDVVRKWVPLTAGAFSDYRVDAVALSGKAKEIVRRRLAGESLEQPDSGLSRREWNEMVAPLLPSVG